MEKIKNYLISLGITFGLVLVFSFFINLFSYFDLFNLKVYKVILILFVSISMFIGSFLIGKKANQKGYLEGIKFGLVTIILMFFISFLAFDNGFSLETLIYYLILIIVSGIGGTVGINKKISE